VDPIGVDDFGSRLAGAKISAQLPIHPPKASPDEALLVRRTEERHGWYFILKVTLVLTNTTYIRKVNVQPNHHNSMNIMRVFGLILSLLHIYIEVG
jgi:hypothetical protein